MKTEEQLLKEIDEQIAQAKSWDCSITVRVDSLDLKKILRENARLRAREQELLEKCNEYLQRARDAKAALK